MFGSNRNNQDKSRKRFWPFGRKDKTEKQDQATSLNEEEAISTGSTEESDNRKLPDSEKITPSTVTKDAKAPVNPVCDHSEAGNATTLKTAKNLHKDTPPKSSLLSKMRSGLAKTRRSFIGGVINLFAGKKTIDEDLLEELETLLITADIGMETTVSIIDHLTQKLKRKELNDMDAFMSSLRQQLCDTVKVCEQPLAIQCDEKPYVILVVGVNGAGKTTTIGKLASHLQQSGKKVMLAAGDTFRAAAIEQLQEWGEKNRVPVIAQHNGADSASVIYDAYNAAKSRHYDVLIADTAGRLHNKENLMNELKKIKRILGRLDASSPHEVMLVVDAGTGQNAIQQARLFNEAVQLTGMTLTKLDGTAKGGIVFALARTMQLPIRFLGVGEKTSDLRPFSTTEFVNALFDEHKENG